MRKEHNLIPPYHYQNIIIEFRDGRTIKASIPAQFTVADIEGGLHIKSCLITEPKPLPSGYKFEDINPTT